LLISESGTKIEGVNSVVGIDNNNKKRWIQEKKKIRVRVCLGRGEVRDDVRGARKHFSSSYTSVKKVQPRQPER
jgi:hypothetical protein